MATEFYLVKPEKEEMYCLGKHLSFFTNINEECFGKAADYDEYDCFQDFILDVIERNRGFMESVWEETYGTICDLLYEIWEFMKGNKVLLVSDCSDTFSKYSDYKDAGSIYDFFERRENERDTISSDCFRD